MAKPPLQSHQVKAALIVALLVGLAGCTGSTSPGDGPPPASENASRFTDANFTSDPADDDSWHLLTVNATPNGTIAVYLPAARAEAAGAGDYEVIPFIDDASLEGLEYWGLIAFDISTGEADVSSLRVNAKHWISEEEISRKAARLYTDLNESFGGDLADGDPPGHREHIAVAVFAKAAQPSRFEIGLTFKTLDSDEVHESFATAAAAGQLRRLEVAGEGEGVDYQRVSVDRRSGERCSSPTQGKAVWIGLGSIDAGSAQSGCGLAQSIRVASSMNGWSFAINQVTVVPGVRNIVVEVQGNAREFTTLGPASGSGVAPTHPGATEPTFFASRVGVGGSSITVGESTETDWQNSGGRTILFTTIAPVQEWLGMPISQCSSFGAPAANASEVEAGGRGYCSDPQSFRYT